MQRAIRSTADLLQAKFTGVDIFDRQTSHAEDDSDGDDEERNDAVQEFIRKQWNLNAPFGRAPWKTFHLINSRFLSDGIDRSRWPVLMTEYWSLLSPGGWVQMVEVDWSFQSDNGTRLPNLEAWWNAYREALQQMGKDPIIARNLCHRLRNAGFERVTGNQISVPIGGWQRGMCNRHWGSNHFPTLIWEQIVKLSAVPMLISFRGCWSLSL